MIRRLAREPLVHFLLLGAALFAVSSFAPRREGASAEDRRIVVTAGRLGQLRDGFAAQSGHAPTDEEMRRLVEDHVREEILCREAVRLGLDRDDAVIRKRLAEKVEFVQEDVAGTAPPTDADLQRFLDAHADRYRRGGAAAQLSDVRDAVETDWRFERRKAMNDAAYAELRKKFDVVVEKPETAR